MGLLPPVAICWLHFVRYEVGSDVRHCPRLISDNIGVDEFSTHEVRDDIRANPLHCSNVSFVELDCANRAVVVCVHILFFCLCLGLIAADGVCSTPLFPFRQSLFSQIYTIHREAAWMLDCRAVERLL